MQQTLVIGLAAETADEVGNDGGLVPGTDQHGVVVGRGLQRRRLGLKLALVHILSQSKVGQLDVLLSLQLFLYLFVQRVSQYWF